MFDKVTIMGGQPKTTSMYVTTTVHEHRAPTDDSIRLAQEIEEKCYKNILHTIKSDNNVLNFGAIVKLARTTPNQDVAYAFTLNGKEISGMFTISFIDEITKSKDEIVVKIVDAVSRQIAWEILGHMKDL